MDAMLRHIPQSSLIQFLFTSIDQAGSNVPVPGTGISSNHSEAFNNSYREFNDFVISGPAEGSINSYASGTASTLATVAASSLAAVVTPSVSESASVTVTTSSSGVAEDSGELISSYYENRALDSRSLWTLVAVYTVLILIGALGNGLVCVAVARQPKMRTTRNLFIINLAISDLLLCFFTIPFSLVEISVKSWPFGMTMCKLVVALQATSIFVSTLSITAIALDRYQVILHSMDPDRAGRGAARASRRQTRRHIPHLLKLLAIWLCAILLAAPLYIYRTVHSFEIGIAELDPINFCVENWPILHGRLYYSIFSMLIQYLVPITIVSVVYTRLGLRLKTRALRRTSTTALPKLRTRLQARARRTNLLLVAIALVFCVSWLPLNLLNIIADVADFSSDKSFRITFAICHIAGMSSSCTNPFLYGWLNQNFRNEFEDIFYSLKCSFFRICLRKDTLPPVSGNNRHAASRRASRVSLTLSPNVELTNCQTTTRSALYADGHSKSADQTFDSPERAQTRLIGTATESTNSVPGTEPTPSINSGKLIDSASSQALTLTIPDSFPAGGHCEAHQSSFTDGSLSRNAVNLNHCDMESASDRLPTARESLYQADCENGIQHRLLINKLDHGGIISNGDHSPGEQRYGIRIPSSTRTITTTAVANNNSSPFAGQLTVVGRTIANNYNGTPTLGTANGKFKRLSLTDSRKRKRKLESGYSGPTTATTNTATSTAASTLVSSSPSSSAAASASPITITATNNNCHSATGATVTTATAESVTKNSISGTFHVPNTNNSTVQSPLTV